MTVTHLAARKTHVGAHHPNHCEAYDSSSTSNDNRTMMMMMAMMMMHWKAEMCWCKHLFRIADDPNG